MPLETNTFMITPGDVAKGTSMKSSLRPLFLILLLSTFCPDLPAEVWAPETIHEQKYFGLSKYSQVSDDAGNPHIFYGGSHLFHGYKDANNTWIEEVVDGSPQVGRSLTAAKDANGNFHILYSDQLETIPYTSGHVPGIKYAYGNSGSWTVETTPIPPDTFGRTYFGGHKSADLDLSGSFHFTYIDDATLYHAVRGSSGWSIEEVLSFNNDPSDPGDVVTVVDNDNVVHIAYFNPDTAHLDYAYNNDGNWIFETISSNFVTYSYRFVSLAVNSQNHVFACYQQKNPISYQLFCSDNSQGAWSQDLVNTESTGSSSRYHPSIYIDDNDHLHLAYINNESSENYYVGYATKDNSTWSHHTYPITKPVSYTRLSNIAVTGDGSISLFYIDQDPDTSFSSPMDLSNITFDGFTFNKTHVATGDNSNFITGQNSDIATDSDGHTHVIYVVEDNPFERDLYYSTNITGRWEHERLASFSDYSNYVQPSLLVDDNNFAHIVYAQAHTSGTHYLSNRTGVWTNELIDPVHIAVGEYSMKMDSNGRLHVAYLSNGDTNRITSWQLRYVTNLSNEWVSTQVYEYEPRNVSDYTRRDIIGATAELDIDANNNIRIAFTRFKRLFMAVKTESNWDIDIILSSESVPYYFVDVVYNIHWGSPSIAFDDNHNLHFGYAANECRGGLAVSACYPGGIRYSKYSADGWQHFLVDAELYYLESSSSYLYPSQPKILVLDDGTVYIAYYHNAYEHIRVAEISVNRLTSSIAVDTDPNVYRSFPDSYYIDASLAVMPDKSLSMTYHDITNKGLKLAVSKPGLEVYFHEKDSAGTQPLEIDISNQSLNPITVSNISLTGYPDNFIQSNTCANDMLNPSNSCLLTIQINSPLVTTVSAILQTTVTDTVTNDINLAFVSLPRTIMNVDNPLDDSSTDSTTDNNGGSGGGGGSLTFYLLVILLIYKSTAHLHRTSHV
jgi:hypothetical protein